MPYHPMPSEEEMRRLRHLSQDLTVPPLVTVCGEFGTGASHVAMDLARILNVRCYDQRTLDAMVRELMASEDFQNRNRGKKRISDLAWIAALFEKKMEEDPDSALVHLVKVVMGASREGGVLVGRGCHVILAGQKVFRLRIEGGPEFCARQVAEEEWVDLPTALKMVKRINEENVRFVREVYRMFPGENGYYDLILNAELFPRDRMVAIALAAMGKSGFLVPRAKAA